jgi:hypothetical protein
LPEEVSRAPLAWPLDAEALEDLRWYLEDYLPAPFGMWENRGPTVRAKLTGWAGPGRDAYQRARDRGLEVVFHVVHFDGHGVMRGRSGGGAAGARPA